MVCLPPTLISSPPPQLPLTPTSTHCLIKLKVNFKLQVISVVFLFLLSSMKAIYISIRVKGVLKLLHILYPFSENRNEKNIQLTDTNFRFVMNAQSDFKNTPDV